MTRSISNVSAQRKCWINQLKEEKEEYFAENHEKDTKINMGDDTVRSPTCSNQKQILISALQLAHKYQTAG